MTVRPKDIVPPPPAKEPLKANPFANLANYTAGGSKQCRPNDAKDVDQWKQPVERCKCGLIHFPQCETEGNAE